MLACFVSHICKGECVDVQFPWTYVKYFDALDQLQLFLQRNPSNSFLVEGTCPYPIYGGWLNLKLQLQLPRIRGIQEFQALIGLHVQKENVKIPGKRLKYETKIISGAVECLTLATDCYSFYA